MFLAAAGQSIISLAAQQGSLSAVDEARVVPVEKAVASCQCNDAQENGRSDLGRVHKLIRTKDKEAKLGQLFAFQLIALFDYPSAAEPIYNRE